MAEIRNYTMNFSVGRASRLTFAARTLAATEIHRERAVMYGLQKG
ncbi:MAG: hypothetical protein ACM3NI_01520 [Bacteroidota bacterium]